MIPVTARVKSHWFGWLEAELRPCDYLVVRMMLKRIKAKQDWELKPIFICGKTMPITCYLCMCSVTQSCPTLCDPMDCSLPSSSVHGTFQARILKWFAISFSRGSSPCRDWNCISQVSCRQIVYRWVKGKPITCHKWKVKSLSPVRSLQSHGL